MTTCTWDTGSATGCQPACDQRATQAVTAEAYRGPSTSLLCDRHAPLVAPRIYPYVVLTVERL